MPWKFASLIEACGLEIHEIPPLNAQGIRCWCCFCSFEFVVWVEWFLLDDWGLVLFFFSVVFLFSRGSARPKLLVFRCCLWLGSQIALMSIQARNNSIGIKTFWVKLKINNIIPLWKCGGYVVPNKIWACINGWTNFASQRSSNDYEQWRTKFVGIIATNGYKQGIIIGHWSLVTCRK